MWGGEEKSGSGQPTQVPIVQSVSFGYEDIDQWIRTGRGTEPGHIYSRNTNPTVKAFLPRLNLAHRAAMGIPEGLVRYSVGIEDVNDLIADIDKAMEGIGRKTDT